MDTTCWHMNATLGGANLHPGVNLHPGANCAYEHGLRIRVTLIQILTPALKTHSHYFFKIFVMQFELSIILQR